MLTQVLQLNSPPILLPGFILGYSIKMWGPYPILVEGPTGNVVNGLVYEVQREKHGGDLRIMRQTGMDPCCAPSNPVLEGT